MSNIEWTYKISKGSGQKKDKEGDIEDKSLEYKLSLSIKGNNEQLHTILSKIAPLIAKTGGQETLDLDDFTS